MPLRKRSTSQHHGAHGEQRACDYLKSRKFKLLHRNFKTPRYEIDIIAEYKRRLYFIEVKYRSSAQHGQGSEYVTDAKLRQMSFAAEHWVAQHGYDGPFQLAVISVDGDSITMIDDIWQ